MDKKVLIALGVSVGIIVFWQRFVVVPQPDATPAETTPRASGEGAGAVPNSEATVGAPAGSDKPVGTDVAKPSAGEATRQPESFSAIEMAGRYHAQLSTWGGALHDVTLLDPRYKEKLDGNSVQIDLVPQKSAPLPFSVTFPDSGFQLPADADFQLVATDDANVRRYVSTVVGARITKTWRFLPDTYEARLDVTVENLTDKALPATMKIAVVGWQNPEIESSFLRPSVTQTEGLCSTGSIKRENLKSLLKESVVVDGPVRVVGIDRKYFAIAAAIAPLGRERCKLEAEKNGRITASLTVTPEVVPVGGKKTWSLTTFAGPKVIAELKSAKVGGVDAQLDAHLGDIIPHGLWGLTEVVEGPMFWVLTKIHQVLGNWGIAIILLTMLIKVITWWPTAQSMKSAQAMARLKPEMDKLREKYGDDKAKMNQETMLLYQKHKINPLGGCLPVLLQMPVYIALYSMLGNSVELYGSALGFWIHDLTGPDPYFVLPLMTGAIMFLQQKLSPTPPDPQQKTMMTIMPVMFTGMSAFLPSGLTLYILTNTALSMIQQRISTPKKPASGITVVETPNKTNKKKA